MKIPRRKVIEMQLFCLNKTINNSVPPPPISVESMAFVPYFFLPWSFIRFSSMLVLAALIIAPLRRSLFKHPVIR